MSHPLDISGLLQNQKGTASKPLNSIRKEGTDSEQRSGKGASKPRLQNLENEASISPKSPRIQNQFWEEFDEDCRRFMTSRCWKGVDFNPMFLNLDDITKISLKWLKWAVPTYVNGLESGPIHDWLAGDKKGKDFHYVLVGEHLRFMKEQRQAKKDKKRELQSEIKQKDQELRLAVQELDHRLNWFKDFLSAS